MGRALGPVGPPDGVDLPGAEGGRELPAGPGAGGNRYQRKRTVPDEDLGPLVATDMTAGRGRGKIAPRAAAEALLAGVEAERDEIRIGQTRLVGVIDRLAPALAARLLRGARVEAV